jgi:hypothetical protein
VAHNLEHSQQQCLEKCQQKNHLGSAVLKPVLVAQKKWVENVAK